jgi:hypothetical protein
VSGRGSSCTAGSCTTSECPRVWKRLGASRDDAGPRPAIAAVDLNSASTFSVAEVPRWVCRWWSYNPRSSSTVLTVRSTSSSSSRRSTIAIARSRCLIDAQRCWVKPGGSCSRRGDLRRLLYALRRAARRSGGVHGCVAGMARVRIATRLLRDGVGAPRVRDCLGGPVLGRARTAP